MNNESKLNPTTPLQCKDGRWVSSVILKNDNNGNPLRKSIFADSKSECEKKMKEFLDKCK